MPSAETIGLITAVTVASAVEVVEALTIVLAMGIARGWRSALAGALAALVALAVITLAAGLSLGAYVSQSLLQFVIGALLLVFGLQWLRKAMLRSAGLKAVHDEDRIFAEEREAARAATSRRRFGIDGFGFVVAFKGVLLEGIEVVFIVITFGIGAASRGVPHAIALAAAGAAFAALVVTAAGAILRRPLAMVPENAMKYVVALLLSSFGLFWAVEGIGFFGPARESLEWPGGAAALIAILLVWIAISQATVVLLRALARRRRQEAAL